MMTMAWTRQIATLGLVAVFTVAWAGCSRPPLERIRGAAMFPNLQARAKCRVDRSPGIHEVGAIERGQVVEVVIDGQSVVRRVVGIAGDTVAWQNGRVILGKHPVQVRVERERTPCGAGISARCACQIVVEQHGGRDIRLQRLHPTQTSDDFRCDRGRNAPPVMVPPGHVYVLADNRDGAVDSRAVGPLRPQGRVVSCR